MKKLFVLFAVLLLCSCAASHVYKDDTALLTVNGKTLVTGLDLKRASVYEDESVAFTALYEYSLLAYLAERYGVQENEQTVAGEVDSYMQDIEQNDPDAYAYEQGLQKELGMNEQEYRAYRIKHELMVRSANKLIDDISSMYVNVKDAYSIEEYIKENLSAMIEELDIKCGYEKDFTTDFTYALNQEI